MKNIINFKATIHTIRYIGESSLHKKNFGNKYVVFTIKKKELPDILIKNMPYIRGGFNKHLLIITGYTKEAIEEGQTVNIDFTLDNLKFDTQFKSYSLNCEKIIILHEMTKLGFIRYLKEKYKGIGEKKALKIIDFFIQHYGDECIPNIKELFINDFTNDNINLIKYIGKKSYFSIKEQIITINENNNEVTLTDDEFIFVTKYNLSLKRMIKLKSNIIKLSSSKYSNEYKDHNIIPYLKNNPYILAIDSNFKNMGFKIIDKIVFSILNEKERNTEKFMEQRLMGFLKYTLVKKIEEGNLFINKVDIYEEFHKINLSNPERSFDLPETADLLFDNIKFIISKLDKAVNPFIIFEDKIFLKKYLEKELLIAIRLLEMKNKNFINIDKQYIIKILDSVSPKEWKLSDEQTQAVINAIMNPISIITGGPGTGKTTISTMVVKVLKKMGKRVKILAPTGTAAKRISTVVGEEATTIHRGLDFKGHFNYNFHNPLKEEVIIVDESSMVDVLLGKALIDASYNSQIIFIGDVNQLPSVGAGDFLRDLINSNQFHVSKLTKVFRQAGDNPIIQFAYKVLNGAKIQDFFKWYTIKNDLSDLKLSIPFKKQFKSDNENYLKNMRDFIIEEGIKNYLISGNTLFDTQILVASNRDNDYINLKIRNIINENGIDIPNSYFNTIFNTKELFKIGDKIIQIKNNYKYSVFNGSIGYIVDYKSSTDEIGIKYMEAQESIKYLPKKIFIKENKLCYSMTIHKSQGQEFKQVLMLINNFMLNNREMLYTGATRAKEKLIIVSNSRLLSSGISTTNKKGEGVKKGKQARNTYLFNFLKNDLNDLKKFNRNYFLEDNSIKLEFD